MKLRSFLFCTAITSFFGVTTATALPINHNTDTAQRHRSLSPSTEDLNKQSLENAQKIIKVAPCACSLTQNKTLQNIPLNTKHSVIAAGTGVTTPIIAATPQGYTPSRIEEN